jgi:hypothetical protein
MGAIARADESAESDGIVVWQLDRLFCQPRDLETPDRPSGQGIPGAEPRRIKRRFATMREHGIGYIGGRRRFGWPGRDLTRIPAQRDRGGAAESVGRFGGA